MVGIRLEGWGLELEALRVSLRLSMWVELIFNGQGGC